ncbi:MAG TPA: hypothetical protein VGD52_09840 [Pseudoduganella sp.]
MADMDHRGTVCAPQSQQASDDMLGLMVVALAGSGQLMPTCMSTMISAVFCIEIDVEIYEGNKDITSLAN